ncbi:selenide, water dikinase SelD [Segetibacter koreensis]|uniref:selenide, water dikinase SelD n=1 Tax=Segetibacter koreensis TaxID=398037 RepID=UPI00039CEF4F
MNSTDIKLTQYSHGAGCGCKIAPKVLDQILQSNFAMPDNNRLLVGNHSKDDAAVFDMQNGQALISTTDFFMPIVDDAYQFGRIASANAISDVYAMGGKPIVAIAILGWPINKISPEVAKRVIEGSRSICMEAGIPLAGGHSIDSPEPIFGLAVNGIVDIKNIKQNNTAQAGNVLFLTKKIGVGILTTAEKKGILRAEHQSLAATQMEQLNKVGEALGNMPGVTAMTDVTGFGLLGHLAEMCEGSNVSAQLNLNKIPLLTNDLKMYIYLQSVPGGTNRNWDSYGGKISFAENIDKNYATALLADPQTSGGLLIAVDANAADEVQDLLQEYGLYNTPIGRTAEQKETLITVL